MTSLKMRAPTAVPMQEQSQSTAVQNRLLMVERPLLTPERPRQKTRASFQPMRVHPLGMSAVMMEPPEVVLANPRAATMDSYSQSKIPVGSVLTLGPANPVVDARNIAMMAAN